MERLDNLRPLILFVSGMMGAMGVALAAAASHAGDTLLLGSASTMCLAHAIGETVEAPGGIRPPTDTMLVTIHARRSGVAMTSSPRWYFRHQNASSRFCRAPRAHQVLAHQGRSHVLIAFFQPLKDFQVFTARHCDAIGSVLPVVV